MIDETSESDDEDDDNYGSIEKEKKKPVQEKHVREQVEEFPILTNI